jgi:hypothetical protein
MEKDKLIEKGTAKYDILIECVQKYKAKLIPGGKYTVEELLVMTKEIALEAMELYRQSLTAPVDGKMTDADIFLKSKEIAKQQHYPIDSDTDYFAVVWEMGAKWMQNKLTNPLTPGRAE